MSSNDYDEGYRAGMQKMQDLSRIRIQELEDALRTVDAWIEDCRLYAPEGSTPATAFKRVKEVLSK